MSRRHQREASRTLALFFVALLTILAASDRGIALLPSPNPNLHFARTIRTRPFRHTSVFMKDSEGSAYVPRDRSLWLADDNGRRLFEVNPATGSLKRVVGAKRLAAARHYRGTGLAGGARTMDIESLAYDRAHDALYVFSGPCCSSTVKPTVFRLRRNANGKLAVESFQPLPDWANFTAAAWSASTRKMYVGHGADLRIYRYATNSIGRAFRVPNLSGITGMGFTPDGKDAFVTTNQEKLRRVRWRKKRLVPGWTFDLSRFGIRDGRAVELIGGRFYVSDGSDARSANDPRKYAVYVFTLS